MQETSPRHLTSEPRQRAPRWVPARQGQRAKVDPTGYDVRDACLFLPRVLLGTPMVAVIMSELHDATLYCGTLGDRKEGLERKKGC